MIGCKDTGSQACRVWGFGNAHCFSGLQVCGHKCVCVCPFSDSYRSTEWINGVWDLLYLEI